MTDIIDMIDIKKIERSPYILDNKVIFYAKDIDAENLSIIGNFNNWDKNFQLKKISNNEWISDEIVIKHPGRYIYRFVSNDNNYFTDNLNKNRIINKYGEHNVFEVWFDFEGFEEQINGIKNEMRKNPPQGGNQWIRDVFINVLDRYLMIPHINRSSIIKAFFEYNLKQILLSIPISKAEKNIILWQGYNSGYFFKTKEKKFGIDIVSTRNCWNLNWDIPEFLIPQIVNCLDFLLISHIHSDHCDFEIIETMLKNNKYVFGPEGLKDKFKSEYFFPLKGGEDINFYNFKIKVIKTEHVYDNGRNILSLLYLIETPDGFKLLFTGDSDYTKEFKNFNDKINILITKYGGVNPNYSDIDALKILFSKINFDLVIPAHIQELAHYPGGGRESYAAAIKDFEKLEKPFKILLWGEKYIYA